MCKGPVTVSLSLPTPPSRALGNSFGVTSCWKCIRSDFDSSGRRPARGGFSPTASVSVPAGSDPAGRIGWQLSVKRTRDKKSRQRKDR